VLRSDGKRDGGAAATIRAMARIRWINYHRASKAGFLGDRMKRAVFSVEWFTVCALVLLGACLAIAQELANPLPTSPGASVFGERCASCHVNQSTNNRAPDLTTLMKLTPETIYTAVTAGSMVVAAQQLTDEQKRQVAEYLGGRPLDLTDTGSKEKMANPCTTNPGFTDPSGSASWNGWGADPGNTRSQDAQAAGLSAEQVPQLKLKWAFGFPKGDNAYGQPSVVGGRVFVASDNGYVYSLDATTGCVYWSFHARAGVRTAPVVAPLTGQGSHRYAVYVGDMRANAYALDASTGRQLWMRELSDHYTARITAAPALYQSRLYVPISATEEVFSAAPSYPCCTFRGSVVALDANSGEQIWRTYAIPETPRPVRKNSVGTQLWAPAGAAIWNSPTIDSKRHVLYVGTGDAYTEPASKNSDAVLAIELTTGKIRWSFQAVPRDAWMVGCVPTTTENCPKDLGVDFDLGASPILLTIMSGREVLLAASKSGTVFALDPDRRGAVLWSVNLSETTAPNNGQIAFGGAADSSRLYLALEDGTFAAIDLNSGKRAWITRLESLENLGEPTSNGENRTKTGLRFGQSAAVTEIPGAVFTGGWDGILRALSTTDGRILWQFDTAQEFRSVNGVPARGGSMGGPGVVVVAGMLYAPSGYAHVGGGMPGNILLAFAVD
jgi:polyvinyl alcohol dehydrogenase (cytochrome)